MSIHESAGPRMSPRTKARPMAFTGAEFRGGLGWTLLMIYLAVPLASGIVSALDALDGPAPTEPFVAGAAAFGWVLLGMCTYGVIFVIAAMLVGAALAFPLGRSLAAVRSSIVHLACFSLLGGVVGAVAMTAAAGVRGPTAAVVLACAIAVPAAWWITSRRALRRDHRVASDTPVGS